MTEKQDLESRAPIVVPSVSDVSELYLSRIGTVLALLLSKNTCLGRPEHPCK